jgi:Zn-dependent protease
MNTTDIALGAVWYLVFLFSTTCHEAAHALVAKWGGDLTASEAGQVTLNPIPHIRRSPFGMVIVPIASFVLGGWMIGWASAPYDPAWQRRHPHRAGWMALAGPASNFTLMLAAAIAIRVGVALGHFAAPVSISGYAQLTVPAGGTAPNFATSALSILFVLNLLLGTFNLLPVPPLDGYSGIMLLMPESLALRYLDFMGGGRFMFLGLLVAWKAYDYIFGPLFALGLHLLYPSAHYS